MPDEKQSALHPLPSPPTTGSRRQLLFAGLAAIATATTSPGRSAAALLVREESRLNADLLRSFWSAVHAGDRAAVAALLDADGGLIGRVDPEGRSPFAVAHLEHHGEVAELLRARGHQPDLHEAALALDWTRFEELAGQRPGEVNSAHPIGGTTMHAAALGGAQDSIWRVYAQAGNPNPALTGPSPLQVALSHPDLAVAEMTAATLLANAASPHPPAPPRSGGVDPPLHLAAARGSAVLAEMLVRHGADPELRNTRGRTAAERAHESGHRNVETLLTLHTRIARTHHTGRTASTVDGAPYRPPQLDDLEPRRRHGVVGMAHRDLDGVRAATGGEARLAHSVATTGERAVEAGAHMGRRDIVDHLLGLGAPYALTTAVMRDDRLAVERALDADPLRIHERGAHDFALLWYPLIGRCDPAMTELLLARGARVDEQHFLGTTALHWACMTGDLAVIELLLAAGCDIDRPGRKFGPEPLRPIDHARPREHAEVVDLLRARGARA